MVGHATCCLQPCKYRKHLLQVQFKVRMELITGIQYKRIGYINLPAISALICEQMQKVKNKGK